MNIRTIAFAALLAATATTASAQEVFNEIRNKAAEIAGNPATDNITKQINQFKADALNYMAMKMKETMPDSTVAFLDKQAMAMNNFMLMYMKNLIECRTLPQKMQVKVIKLFMDASYSNPLFNDDDTELTLSYYADGKSLTRFSLDTDWRRANAAAYDGMVKITEQAKTKQ